jgi:hypothetical protein
LFFFWEGGGAFLIIKKLDLSRAMKNGKIAGVLAFSLSGAHPLSMNINLDVFASKQ